MKSKINHHERAILVGLADGRSVKEVAASLDMPYQTVKNRLAKLYAKLGVSGTIGAYAALGWLRIPKEKS